MAEQFTVALEALSAYAAVCGELSKDLDGVRSGLTGCGVPPGAFGLLLEAKDLDEGYAERSQAGLDSLADASDYFSMVENAMKSVRDAYAASDQANNDGFAGEQ